MSASKRMLIKDITVNRPAPKQVLLHIRWQGGASTDATVDLPPGVADQVRHPRPLLERILELAVTLTNAQVADRLNREGLRSPKGKSFTASMIQWVRYRIPGPQLRQAGEFTVDELMAGFDVRIPTSSQNINKRKLVTNRKIPRYSGCS
jgi:hypothetical protein